MMVRKILYILLILLFAIPAFGATYYMRDEGTAANKAAATGCGAASSAMNEAVHNAESFAAGDIIYLCDDDGSFGSDIVPPTSGTDGSVITYIEAVGDTTVMAAKFDLSGLDYIRIENLTFNDMERAVITDNTGTLSTGIEVVSCDFGRASSGMGSIFFPWVNDSVIAFCDFDSDSTSTVGQNIEIRGGKRNKIIGNTTLGGKTAIIFKQGRSYSGGLAAGIIEDNIIAGNTCDEYKEEGISFDFIGDSQTDNGAMEYDLVESSATNTVTLGDSGWDGSPLDYTDFYMGFLSGTLVGKVYKITGHTADTFTFTETVSSASATDKVVIFAPFLNNYIGFNKVTDSYPEDDILIYGAGVGNVIEFNNGEDLVGSDDAGMIHIRSLRNIDPQTGSVAGYCGQAPSFNNLVINNTAYGDGTNGMTNWTYNVNRTTGSCSQVASLYSVGNTFYGNTTPDDRLYVATAYYYESGNTWGAVKYEGTGVVNNVTYAYPAPYITGTPVINAGGGIEITWSETVVVTSYTNGDLYLTTDTDIFTEIPLNSPTGSGASRTFTVTGFLLEGQTYKLWFDGTHGSIVDGDGNNMTVVGFKTITNNYTGYMIAEPSPTSTLSCDGASSTDAISWSSIDTGTCRWSEKGTDTCETAYAGLDNGIPSGFYTFDSTVNCGSQQEYVIKCQRDSDSVDSNCLEITHTVAAAGGEPPQPTPGIVAQIGAEGNITIVGNGTLLIH